jgi:orotate phosphoribosyltransferase
MIDAIGNIVLILIVIITSVSTLLTVLDSAGLLPNKIAKYLMRNKLELTREVLKELGIHTQKTKETISKCLSTESLKGLQNKLNFITYPIEVEIGKTSGDYYFHKYIDLMGATTSERNAMDFARLLKTYAEESEYIDLSSIDFIVTSKLGSPILGYEFSKNVNKPLVLHSDEEKFRSANSEYQFQKKFDSADCRDFKGKKALIVEDSTTGGRKVKDAVIDLRKHGVIVNDCLVVFAPQGKNAKERLAKEGITLHCILETHNEEKS